MPVVRHVAFFPSTGFRDRPWIDDLACDLLVKSARRASECYSEEISNLQLSGKASEVRVFMRPAPKTQVHLSVDVHLDFAEGFESAVALIPAGVARLDADERAELAFDVLDGVMRALAAHRGWPTNDLDVAESRTRARGLEFVWRGPWKSSPDRRHEARGAFWLEDDGFGRAAIEIRARGETGATILRSLDQPAYCTSAGFARSAKTLRWTNGVATMVASIDILGRTDGEIRFDPTSGGTGTAFGRRSMAQPATRDRPEVKVTSSRRVPETHTIRFIGGGPTNGVPPTYQHGLAKHLKHLSEDGLPWWSSADRHLLEITYRITDGDVGVKVRRLTDRVTAVIQRPRGTLNLLNGGRLAREDVCALVEAVSNRLSLSNPPSM